MLAFRCKPARPLVALCHFAIAQGKYLFSLLNTIKNYQKNQDDIYVILGTGNDIKKSLPLGVAP